MSERELWSCDLGATTLLISRTVSTMFFFAKYILSKADLIPRIPSAARGVGGSGFTFWCRARPVSSSCRSSSPLKEVSLTRRYSLMVTFHSRKSSSALGRSAPEASGIKSMTYSIFSHFSLQLSLIHHQSWLLSPSCYDVQPSSVTMKLSGSSCKSYVLSRATELQLCRGALDSTSGKVWGQKMSLKAVQYSLCCPVLSTLDAPLQTALCVAA